MKTKTLLLLLLLASSNIIAQKDSAFTLDIGYSASIRTNFINLDELNSVLKSYNYPVLSNTMFSLVEDIYFYPVKEKVMQRISGNLVCAQEKENNTHAVKFAYYDVCIDLGYNILNKKKTFFYPIAGFGYSFYNLKIIDKSVEPSVFNQAISNLNGITEVYTQEKKILCLLNIGVKLDWSIKKDDKFLVGFDAGYKLQLSKSKWQTNNHNLSGEPEINLNGFYAGLHLTFF